MKAQIAKQVVGAPQERQAVQVAPIGVGGLSVAVPRNLAIWGLDYARPKTVTHQ
jgi:hypothetical protein